MPASFPDAIKTFVAKTDGVDYVLAEHVNDMQNEITAIETELGSGTAGVNHTNVRDRITSIETALAGVSGSVSSAGRWIYPNDDDWVGTANMPLTSTSFDGDSFSTTAKTLIDLSAEFTVPAGIKAALFFIQARDSASASSNCFFGLSPNNTAGSYPLACKPYDRANDTYEHDTGVVPCDANGDVYYQCLASGAGTLDVVLQIWGYHT